MPWVRVLMPLSSKVTPVKVTVGSRTLPWAAMASGTVGEMGVPPDP